MQSLDTAAAPRSLLKPGTAWRRRFQRWVDRRMPPAREVVLGHRNIFILPNRQGLGFVAVLVLLFIGAVNYESNLGFALVFLLVGMFVLSIFHTFRNLAGLRISGVPGTAVFAGEMAEVTVILRREGERTYENVEVSCETVFPFGICRAWSLPDLRLRCLVYPRPQECDLDWLLANQLHAGNTTLVRGSDDFHSLREYRAGDPLKHVAWKNFARGQGMLLKEFASTMDQKVWLRWEMFSELDTESRLSRLCWCAIRLDETGIDFGLEIPGRSIAPAKGEVHYRQVLEALALPPESNARARAFAQELRAANVTDGEFIQAVLAHFRNQPFFYTLSPALLGEQPVDEFLFETREGFCEHYASAFTFLMRAAGIPARVVTGYMGGEFNPYDGALTVRQYDAHAWSEVWLPDEGWVRVDPTGAPPTPRCFHAGP